MHWTVQHVVTDDYTMFVHLLNRTDQAVDGVNAYHLSKHTAPMNGSWATRSSQALCLISQPVCGRGLIVLSWECIPRKPGETIITSTVLDIPASVRARAHSLELGMYSAFDFDRIPTVDAATLIFGNRILLGW